MIEEKDPLTSGMRICLVSDFFFPNIGGVEAHIYSLAYCLSQSKHKIVIITRERKDFNLTGVRYYSNNLKVYYVPGTAMGPGIVMPMNISTFSLILRNILLREKIQVIHGHQRSSLLVIIMIVLSRIMEIPCVITQHSLFDFNDLGSIELNRVYRLFNKMISHTICVSNTVRENVTLGSHMEPAESSVIPNALDSTFYCAQKVEKNPSKIKIIVFSRLTFRKGVDLLLEILPIVCMKYPNIEFAISGDGPKRVLIEKIVEEYGIQNQVQVQGFTEFKNVPTFLSSGDIFLNVSISEAFCMAILEAAACGLYVVSTDVGGIPEILPPEQMTLCKPNAQDMIEKLSKVIDEAWYKNSSKSPAYIKESYDWFYVAEKTAQVYERALKTENKSSFRKLALLAHTKYIPGFFIVIVCLVFLKFFIWFSDNIYPRGKISKSKKFVLS